MNEKHVVDILEEISKNPRAVVELILSEIERYGNAIRAEIERLTKERDEAKTSSREAFVAGAKWWQFEKNGSTMFSSEVDQAENVAEERFPFAPWIHMIALKELTEKSEAQQREIQHLLEGRDDPNRLRAIGFYRIDYGFSCGRHWMSIDGKVVAQTHGDEVRLRDEDIVGLVKGTIGAPEWE